MTKPIAEWAARLADRFLGNVGIRHAPNVGMGAQPVPFTDGVVAMTLAALAASAAVLSTSVWFVATSMKGSGVAGLGALFLLAAGGGLTLVPIAAGLALRARGRPMATRSAWVLMNAFVIVGVLDSTLLASVFFGPALFVILPVEVIGCCLAARGYTIWRASLQGAT